MSPEGPPPPDEAAAFPPGTEVRLYPFGRRSISIAVARVLSAGDELLELSLHMPVAHPLLDPGKLVLIRRPGQREEQGQVLLSRAGPAAVLVVRLLTDTFEDRRAGGRYIPVDPLKAQVARVAGGRATSAPAIVLDIATGGVGLLCEAEIEVGADVLIRIEAPNRALAFSAAAVVRWCKPTATFRRFGASFNADPGRSIDALIHQALSTESRFLSLTRTQ